MSANFKSNLVVTLAGATMRHGIGAEGPRLGDEVSHNHWTAERRDEWVLSFVARVRHNGGATELFSHLLTSVHDDTVEGAGS